MTNPDAAGKKVRREAEDSQNISILIHAFMFMLSKSNLVNAKCSMYLNEISLFITSGCIYKCPKT